ncbi:hypothetical protein CI266_002157 [Salmonella enterica subsp. enterica serovar Kotte]|nr:hypothetical protein [Salmonella enterica subsp. enterica serovar Kotte]
MNDNKLIIDALTNHAAILAAGVDAPIAYLCRQNAVTRELYGTSGDWEVNSKLVESDLPVVEIPESDDYEFMPLYAAPQLAVWYPSETSPDVPRGESLECWVAVHFEERIRSYATGLGQYRSARPRILRLSWLNAELTDDERIHWEREGYLPDSSPGGLEVWQSEDGEHGDFTGWTGAEGNGYRELVAGADGWVPDGYLVGRFKILAWQPVIKPDFPLGVL